MSWWERLPRTAQAWLTVGSFILALVAGAFALGATSSRTFTVTRELPIRMDNVEAKAIEQDKRLSGHDADISDLRDTDALAEARYDRLICLLLLPDELSAVESERRCP